MRINVAVPEAHVSRPVLDAALEGVTKLNESLLEDGEVPPFRQAAERVRWKPEPPGDEHFDHAGVVLGRGWGDCDDLAPWHAASLRTTGEDPGAKAIVKRSGANRWHAVVKRSDGTIDDPSREAGMGRTNGVMGASLPMMMRPQAVVGSVGSYVLRPQLALRPVRDSSGEVEAWQARADLPWHWVPGKSPTDVAMASLHASPISSQSIVGACQGLIDLGEANDVDDDILDRAEAIKLCCEGADWQDIADELGPEHATAAGQVVGSFFGKLMHRVKQTGRLIKDPGRAVRKIVKYSPAALAFRGVKELTKQPGFAESMQLAQTAAPLMGPMGMAFQMASPMLQQMLASGAHLPPGGRGHMPPGMMPPGMMPPGMMPPGMMPGYGGGYTGTTVPAATGPGYGGGYDGGGYGGGGGGGYGGGFGFG